MISAGKAGVSTAAGVPIRSIGLLKVRVITFLSVGSGASTGAMAAWSGPNSQSRKTFLFSNAWKRSSKLASLIGGRLQKQIGD